MRVIKYLGRFITLLAFCGHARGAYYDTLPKGVRTVVWRHVTTSDIDSKLTETGTSQDYNWAVNLDTETLLSIDAISGIIEEFEEISPDGAAILTAGEYRGEALANVDVDALGFAYGITDKVTAYGYAPYFRANVDLNITKVRGNNVSDASTMISPNADPTAVSFFQSVSPELEANLNERVYQSIFVNNLNYQPLGDWEGTGWGDTELGVIYNFTNFPNFGAAMTGGIVVPTGYEDAPDVVQDFGFGDGQWDIFGEIGGGFDILPHWGVDSWFRFTYQLPATKTLRIPESEDFPYSSVEEDFYIKLGNIIDYSFSSTYQVNDWFSFRPEYRFTNIGLSNYKSSDSEADRIYELRSNQTRHDAILTLNFTTVNWFQQGKFKAPLDLSLSGRTLITGTNTPDVTRFELDFRIYF